MCSSDLTAALVGNKHALFPTPISAQISEWEKARAYFRQDRKVVGSSPLLYTPVENLRSPRSKSPGTGHGVKAVTWGWHATKGTQKRADHP